MSQEPIVKLINVTKKIGRSTIIDDLTFEVPRGEIFGFLGPNGAGKTTTIRMMVGLMSITRGEVMINGKSIRTEFEQAIRHVGAIVENPEMYKYLSGYQNLVHYARMVPGVTKERIQEVITLVKLENRIHDKVKKYSLGMRQRLGVAQALLHRPSVLILDEPTNGLDPAGIRELRDYLRLLTRTEGLTVIVSSHLLSEMELMCDRVAVIQQGKLVDIRQISEYVGTGDQKQYFLFETNQPAEAAALFQDMQNISDISVTAEGFMVMCEREQVPFLVERIVGQDIKLYGIRPQRKSLEDQFLEMTGVDQIV